MSVDIKEYEQDSSIKKKRKMYENLKTVRKEQTLEERDNKMLNKKRIENTNFFEKKRALIRNRKKTVHKN